MIWLVVKFLIKSQKSQEVHHRIIQKQLDKSYNGKITKVSKNLEAVTIENDKKKYLKKDICHQRKDKKLLMISD